MSRPTAPPAREPDDPGAALQGASRPALRPASVVRQQVALVTEGSYPGSGGGVSVWCDELIRHLPEVDFRVIALTLTDRTRPVWEMPPNVVELRQFGIWDRIRDRTRRGRRAPLPGALRALIRFLVSEPPADLGRDVDGFEAALGGVLELAVEGVLAGHLHFEPLVDAFTEELRGADHLHTRHEVALADAIEAANTFMHLLSPLTVDPGPVDLVHLTANGLPVLVALGAQARHGTPYMMSEHGLYLRERYLHAGRELPRPAVRELVLRFHRNLAVLGLRRAALLTPASEFNARWQLAMGAHPSRIHTLYNGVDVTRFPPRTDDVRHPHVVWLGRIDPIKDLHTLIRAADLVHSAAPGVQFRLFGEAAKTERGYWDSCVELIHELRLDSVVKLEGRVDHPAEAFHAGQFSVLSSISEGFPYSVLESMSCGVPVVGTRVGGVPEAIADTGVVVPPRSPRHLADGCLEMLRAGERRRALGAAARARVEQRFTLQLMLARHQELYRSLAEASGATVDLRGSGGWSTVPAFAAPDSAH